MDGAHLAGDEEARLHVVGAARALQGGAHVGVVPFSLHTCNTHRVVREPRPIDSEERAEAYAASRLSPGPKAASGPIPSQ